MIISMTGFSSTILIIPQKRENSNIESQIHLTMTLKSLNSRFFEFNCKLPIALTQLETDLLKFFKSKLHRGNIYFTIHMSNTNAFNPSIFPSLTIIEQYIKAIEQIKKQFPITGFISLKDIINLPNTFQIHEEPIDSSVISILFKEIEKLVEKLIKNQAQEGKKLEEDINGRIENIKFYLNELESRSKIVFDKKKEQLTTALQNALEQFNQENIKETQNLILYNQLEKIDIHEEIVRFKAHLENLVAHIKSDEIEKGKKIDFILQELFREINTITSKCGDALISNLAINIKVELEKAREQTQNIL